MPPTPDQPDADDPGGPATATLNGHRPRTLLPWVRAQAVNVARHTDALRPFRDGEFGTAPASPTGPHLDAANGLMEALRERLKRFTAKAVGAAGAAGREPTAANLARMVEHKHRAHTWVQAVERVWDFYFELFGQRQSEFGPWLLGCDRIAVNCYQEAFRGFGDAAAIPAPPPFSYMRTGFSPATYRRGIPLRRLGLQKNPFPLVQLPYHRLVNPWTLGAVLHEVCHNLHNDLGLERVIPAAIGRRLLKAGLGRGVAAVYTRWNREIFADFGGLLLGGPAVVASLMDVIGRSPKVTLTYVPRAPHPTPYLRALLSAELLRRMGFADLAASYRRAWTRVYPNPRAGSIPTPLLDTFERACPLVVDTICYRPYAAIGNRPLAEVIRFGPREQEAVAEAARRLAAGGDPGTVPERFFIGAARVALDEQLATPGVISENFYKALTRR